MACKLYPHQRTAVDDMHNGCILLGDVGCGKTITSIAYFYKQCGGDVDKLDKLKDVPKLPKRKHLYVITTAKKRDSHEWELDMIPFNLRSEWVTVDSWNNIGKYDKVTDAFFIFDEQRVVGKGAWVKSFVRIAHRNEWILLSATPGDTWEDYIPVFLANRFYKNRTEFVNEHVIYAKYCKFPKIERYIGIERLKRLRSRVLVNMPFKKHTVPHNEYVEVGYDKELYDYTMRYRWNSVEEKPIETASELCYTLRKIVNINGERLSEIRRILQKHGRAIIFYNYDYELEMIKDYLSELGITFAEWNGHKHQPVPTEGEWAYLVQYTAGSEGWNCVACDATIFYSQNYSYKILKQSMGRIDRMNTPYIHLYYYHIRSKAPIDIAIGRAIKDKKKFNEGMFVK